MLSAPARRSERRRGGGWNNPDKIVGTENCRTANRNNNDPDNRNNNIGFRLVFVP